MIPYVWNKHPTPNITPCAIANGASFGKSSKTDALSLACGPSAQPTTIDKFELLEG